MWTITYRIHREHAWNDRSMETLQQHQQTWASKLSRRASGYNLGSLPDSANAVGTTQLDPATAPRDYVTLVHALRELESLFPGTRVFLTDPQVLTSPTRPGEIDLELFAERLRLPAPAVAAVEERAGPGEDGDFGDDLDPAELEAREKLLRETAEKLEQARRDFEIWKRAQQGKEKTES